MVLSIDEAFTHTNTHTHLCPGFDHIQDKTAHGAQKNLVIHIPANVSLIIPRFLIICTGFSLTPTHTEKLAHHYRMAYFNS